MNALSVCIVDSDYRAIPDARLRVVSARDEAIELREEGRRWLANNVAGDLATIEAEATGYSRETHTVRLRDAIIQVVIGLRRPGELAYSYGDSRLAFVRDESSFLLRLRGTGARKRFAGAVHDRRLQWLRVSPEAADEPDRVYVRVAGNMEDAARLTQDLDNDDLDLQILRIIRHGDRPLLGLNNEIVVRFHDDVTRAEANDMAQRVGMRIARELRHAGNAFVLTRDGTPSYDVLEAADALVRLGRTIYVEPNLTYTAETDQYTPNDPLWAQVPYLQLIKADSAWDRLDNVAADLRGGSPAITIALIDDQGVSPDHPELIAALTDGTNKLVESRNFAITPIAPQTDAQLGGDHGTQCAGTATAAFDDNRGLPGVAPNCRLIGARIDPAMTAVLMSDIYLYVAGFLNGSTAAGFPAAPPARSADVISSSWGVSGLALSNTVRDCFDFLTTYGRGGKGCVLCFSIGNTGYLDFTDAAGPRHRAWPTYERVLGIGTSIGANPTDPVPKSAHPDPAGHTINVRVVADTRALYSPYGAVALRKPDLVAPSSTAMFASNTGAAVQVDPILSAVRVGTGTVNGCTPMAPCNDYAPTFGGTSHSTPTVAGVVALMVSARPDLNWVQVRELLRRTCVRIDAAQANAIGAWHDLDGDQAVDYSRWYGAGRLDADAAVAMALDPSVKLADVYVRDNLADTGALPSTGTWSESPDIWVRQDPAETIPALPWTDPPPHENALRGQDNAVFCRVGNRGTAMAPVVYVRAMVAHWAGLEFAYPADFRPSPATGAPIPPPLARGAYLIGETRVENLAAGADRIVKMTWSAALIPPATIDTGGTPVLWHPCLLVEASPHDGPAPIAGLAVPVQGDNNIAQRNIQIVDPAGGSGDSFIGMMAGSDDDGGIMSVLIDASLLHQGTTLSVHAADAAVMRQLLADALHAGPARLLPRPARTQDGDVAALDNVPPQLRVECMQAEAARAPQERQAEADQRPPAPVTLRHVKHQGLDALEIRGLRDRIEIPLRLASSRFVLLLVAAVGEGNGDLSITQRRGDGALSPGYAIRRQRTPA